MPHPLVSWTDRGLYCAAGDFYIDPHRAVDTAVVTHAHSDHARRGSKRYLCERSGMGLLRARVGKKIDVTGLGYREEIRLGEVTISLHSAGHILGSAQVRIQRGTEVWVASGDYKRDPDPSCEPFEPVRCDTFITEATFGTPSFAWSKSAQHGSDIYEWWGRNRTTGLNSIVFGYSLGKGQRILAELASYADRPILIHSSMAESTQCYRDEGRRLAATRLLEDAISESIQSGEPLSGEMILAPPSVLDGEWADRLGEYRTAFASGWMAGGGYFGRSKRYDHGFVMSDHADWTDLNRTIRETGATRVFVQHRNGVLVRHLRDLGIEAHSAEELALDRYERLPQRNLSLFGDLTGAPLPLS